MGGGDFVVPVQTVTDFLDNRVSGLYLSLSLSLVTFLLITFLEDLSRLALICSNIGTTIELSLGGKACKSSRVISLPYH